ncbi:MAG: zinc ribbon domain-containing protein [Calditrichia bacterium]
MPLFEYRCEDCGNEFEELVSFTNSNDMECPECGSHNTHKKVSTFATLGGGRSSGGSSGSCGSSGGFT